MKKIDIWNASILETSPIINQLSPLTRYFKDYTSWPTLADYENLFKLNMHSIRPVKQNTNINSFDDKYEPRIYLKKELQTRMKNWHDFFNAMIWLRFPKTKQKLNSLHYNTAANRPHNTNRSMLENRITQFDECGAVIISSDKNLLNLIVDHKWKELFVDNKFSFKNSIQCIIFGHALFEKALNPYIGMTSHCLLIEDASLLGEVQSAKFDSLDTRLANLWEEHLSNDLIIFNPLPLLGIPGYWTEQNNEFYQNTNYFR